MNIVLHHCLARKRDSGACTSTRAVGLSLILQLKVKRCVLLQSDGVILLIKRIVVKMSSANRQVSAKASSSSADKWDKRCGATTAWPNRSNASLSVLCSSS